MKQNQNARKQRGRSAARKGAKNSSGGNRSNEPKIRGNPKQLLEKYKTQAREARQAGDRVQAEYFYQFADHYQRILNEIAPRASGQNQQGGDQSEAEEPENQEGPRQRRGRVKRQQRAGGAPNGAETATETASAVKQAGQPDPASAEQPVEVHPELDLDGASTEEKPKRRRAPAQRRRGPRAKTAEEQTPVADATPGKASVGPEGNEAA